MGNNYDFIISKSYIDWNLELISFPIYTSCGVLVGYQQYNYRELNKKQNNSCDGRYYTYVTDKSVPYGLEFYDKFKPIAACEGVFDAISLMSCNINAFAILTASNEHINRTISLFPNEKILVSDGDVKTITKQLIFDSKKQIYKWIDCMPYNSFVICPTNTDPNSLNTTQIQKLLDNRQPIPKYFTQQSLNNAIEFFNKLL